MSDKVVLLGEHNIYIYYYSKTTSLIATFNMKCLMDELSNHMKIDLIEEVIEVLIII